MLRYAVHIYLCDDSPKDYKERYNGQTFATVALRQQMIDALYQVHGIPVIRVTRVKGKGETNPKSANLNNCLKQIYGEAIPPESEVVAVFDADQAAHSHFFTSTLPWMDAGDDVALVQSPQVSIASPDSLSWFCSFVVVADGFHSSDVSPQFSCWSCCHATIQPQVATSSHCCCTDTQHPCSQANLSSSICANMSLTLALPTLTQHIRVALRVSVSVCAHDEGMLCE